MRKIFKILILLSPLFLMVSNSYSQTLIDYVGKRMVVSTGSFCLKRK